MMPVQKVLNIYKNTMDLKDKSGSKAQALQSQKSNENKDNNSDAKKSFQSILNKAMHG
ncbi:MAG: hypothetical protein H7061_05035 [Bdellovibrionaceae bacterium]|nr:hypothetical protein [Bdellovibrio sp.]